MSWLVRFQAAHEALCTIADRYHDQPTWDRSTAMLPRSEMHVSTGSGVKSFITDTYSEKNQGWWKPRMGCVCAALHGCAAAGRYVEFVSIETDAVSELS